MPVYTKSHYRISLASPRSDIETEEAVIDAIRNERHIMGESLYKFEEEYARYIGTKHAVSTSSGTDALTLSMIALGSDERGEVLTTPLSFIATANSILHSGHRPVFVDIDGNDYNIDYKKIESKISSRTWGILPVHLFGYPANMDEIQEIANTKGLQVIEDASQAHGSEYKSKKVGSMGTVGCFSFYPGKNMTVFGDGGMMVTNMEEISSKVSKLRDCGRKSHLEHDIIGYTARLNTINAAVGRVQLKRLPKWVETRRELAQIYNNRLKGVIEINHPPQPKHNINPAYNLYVIRTKDRNSLKEFLESKEVECGIHYTLPIHLQPAYRDIMHLEPGAFPISEEFSKTCLSLPIHHHLRPEDVHYICDLVKEFTARII